MREGPQRFFAQLIQWRSFRAQTARPSGWQIYLRPVNSLASAFPPRHTSATFFPGEKDFGPDTWPLSAAPPRRFQNCEPRRLPPPSERNLGSRISFSPPPCLWGGPISSAPP